MFCSTTLLLLGELALGFQPHVVFVMLDDWGYNDVGFRSTDGLMYVALDAVAHLYTSRLYTVE